MKRSAVCLLFLALTAPVTASLPLPTPTPDLPGAVPDDILASVLSDLGQVLPLPMHPALEDVGAPGLTIEERLRLLLVASRGAPLSLSPSLDAPVPIETALTLFASSVNAPLSIGDYHDAQRLLASLSPTQRGALASLMRDLAVASQLHQEAVADLTANEREALLAAAHMDVASLSTSQLRQLAAIAAGIDKAKLGEAALLVARAVDRYLPVLEAEGAQPMVREDDPLVRRIAALHSAATPYAKVPVIPPTPQFVPTNDQLLAPAFDKIMRAAAAATAPTTGLTPAEAEAWRTFVLARGVAEALPNLEAWSALYLGAPDAVWVAPGPVPRHDLETGLVALALARGTPYDPHQKDELHLMVEGLASSLAEPLARLVSAMLHAQLLVNEATREVPNALRTELMADPALLLRAASFLSSPGRVLSSQEARALEILGKAGEHVDMALIQEAAYIMANTAYAVLPALAVPAETLDLPVVGTTFEPLAREGKFGFAVDSDGDGDEDARITFNGDGTVSLSEEGETFGTGVLRFNQTGTRTKLYADTNGNGVQDCPPPPPPEAPEEGEEPPPEDPLGNDDSEEILLDACAEQGIRVGALLDEDNDVIFRDPLALIIVSGQGTTFYHPDLMLVAGGVNFSGNVPLTVDLGGTDYYAFGAGGGNLFVPALGVDLGGSDLYEALPIPGLEEAGVTLVTQGSGQLSAGVHVDASGYDTYRGRVGTQGSAVLGVGLLIDLGTDSDTYTAWDASQAASVLGYAALIDEGGDDSYLLRPPRDFEGGLGFGGEDARGAGQGAALRGSGATFLDLAGDDRYEAGPISHGWVAQTSQATSLQVPLLTNFALFIEGNGRDTYVGGNGQEENLLTWSTGLGGIGTDLGPSPGLPAPDPASSDGDDIPDSIEATTAIATRVSGGALNVTLVAAQSLLAAVCAAGLDATTEPTTIARIYCGASTAPTALREQVSGRNVVRDDREDPQLVFDFRLGAARLRLDIRPDGDIHNETDLSEANEPVMVLVDLYGNDTYESHQPLTIVRHNQPPVSVDPDDPNAEERPLIPRALVVVDADGNDTYTGNYTAILDLARGGDGELLPARGHDVYGLVEAGERVPVVAGLILDEGEGNDRYITDTHLVDVDHQSDQKTPYEQTGQGVRVGMPTIVFDDGGTNNKTGMSRTLVAGFGTASGTNVNRDLTFQTFFTLGLGGTDIVGDADKDGVSDAIDPDADGDGLLNEEELGTRPIANCATQTLTGIRRNVSSADDAICFEKTDPFNFDTDGDTVPDGGEVVCQRAVASLSARRRLPVLDTIAPPLTRDPYSTYLGEPVRDTDQDGLCDGRDIDHNGNGICDGVDTDEDGFLDKFDHDADGDELCFVGDSDIDGDGLSNAWEIKYYELGLSRASLVPPLQVPDYLAGLPHPYKHDDPGLDPDCDGHSNALEYIMGTDPVEIGACTQASASRLILAPLLDIEFRLPGDEAPPNSLHLVDVVLSIDMTGDDTYLNNAGAGFGLGGAVADSRRWANAPYVTTLVRGHAPQDTELDPAVPLAGRIADTAYTRALELLWGTANLVTGIPGTAGLDVPFDTLEDLGEPRPVVGPLPTVDPFIPFALLVDPRGNDTYASPRSGQGSSGLAELAKNGETTPAQKLRNCLRMVHVDALTGEETLRLPSQPEDPDDPRILTESGGSPPCTNAIVPGGQVPIGFDGTGPTPSPALPPDTYLGRATPLGGFGALIDLAGDDTYRTGGKRSHAYAGPGGIGLLIDTGGSDTLNLPADGSFNLGLASFFQGELVAASSIGGLAVLLDTAGDDVRVIRNDGFGQALIGGLAVLAEIEGDDLYLSSPRINATLHDGPSRSLAWAAGGGVAVLLDLAGSDRYLAGSEALGAAHGGLALFVDRYGDDSYTAIRKALGYANATEVPLKHTWGYENETSGETEKRSEVPFIGDTPVDHVLAERVANGTIGAAVFLDAHGDDTYRLTGTRMLRPVLAGQDNRTQLHRPEGLGWGGPRTAVELNGQVLSGVIGLFADAADSATVLLPTGAVFPIPPTWQDGNSTGVGTAQELLDPANDAIAGLPVSDIDLAAGAPRCIVAAAPPECDEEDGATVLTPGATIPVTVTGAASVRVGARLHGYPVGVLSMAVAQTSCLTGACVLTGDLELELPVWAEELGAGELTLAAVALSGAALGRRVEAPALPAMADTAPRPIALRSFQDDAKDLPTLEWGLLGAVDDLACPTCETTLLLFKHPANPDLAPVDVAIPLAPAETVHDLTQAELPATDLAAMPWSWAVRVRDARGNVLTSDVRTFFIDLSPPAGTAERDEGDSDEFLRGATRFTGEFQDETVLRSVVVDLRKAGRIAAGPYDAALSIAHRDETRVVTEWRVDIPSLPSGSYSLRATGEDAAGRIGEVNLRIQFDTRAPTVRIAMSPPGVGPSGATHLTGTIVDDASGVAFGRLTVYHRDLEGHRTNVVDAAYLTPDANGEVSYPILAHPLEAGTYVIDVEAEDLVGNVRAHRVTIPFDDVLPEPLTALELSFGEGLSRVREGQNVTLTAVPVDRDLNGRATRPWKVLVDATPLAPAVGGLTMADDGRGADALPGDGVFSANVVLNQSIEGRHDLAITVLDVAGNAASSTYAVEVDNTPPVPVALEFALTRTRARLTASLDELVDASFCIQKVGATGRPNCITRVGSVLKLEHVQLAPGTAYDVSWSFTDLAGNVVSERRTITTMDLAAPPAIMIESPAAGSPLRGTVLVETILSAPLGQVLTVTVGLVDGQGSVATERVVTIPVSETALARTLALDTRAAPDGTYTLRVHMVDLDGLEAVSSVPVTVDNTPPAAPQLQVVGVQGADGWFVTPPVALAQARDATTGVDRFLATVGDEHSVLAARQRPEGTATAEVALSDVGTSRLTIEAVDGAGNVGPQRLVDVRFDPTPPHAILAPGRAAVFANATGLAVPVSADDAESGISALQLRIDDRPVTGWLPPADVLRATTRIESGSHALSLVARNGAGVASDALGDVARVPLFIDTDAPVLRSISLSSGTLATPSATTSLSATATDATSEVAEMRFRFAGGSWSAWRSAAAPVPLTLARPDEPVRVDVQVRDSAGNPSAILTAIIVHDTRAPSPPGRPAPVRESADGLGLVWEPAADEHRVDHYLVYASADATHFGLLGSTRENRFRDTTAILGLPTSYRVVAVDEAGWRSEPGPDARLVPTHLAPMAPPMLTGGHHSPESGTTNTLFVFEVTYTDLDNQQPTFVVLEIAGQRHAMTRASPADWDCRDGCVYQLPLTLDAITLTKKHEYRFAASDGTYSVAFPEGTSLLAGPLVAKGTSGSEGGIPGLRVVPAPAVTTLALALALALALGRRRRVP